MILIYLFILSSIWVFCKSNDYQESRHFYEEFFTREMMARFFDVGILFADFRWVKYFFYFIHPRILE